MKHISKALLSVIVLTLAVGILSACGGPKGLDKRSEAFGSPETVARNREPYSTTLIPYESVEQALGGDFTASPYYKSLNGEWDFTMALNPSLMPEGYETVKYAYTVADYAPVRKNQNEPITWGKISVPANWELEGYDAPSYTYNTYPWGNQLVAPNVSESYNPVGIYRNTVEVPSDWSGRQVYVTFEGVASCVYVYVNGALVGYAEDSYTGKTFNITEAVKIGGENLVVFEVYKYCDGSYLEANDSVKFGGIYRDVYLYSAPDAQIRDFTYDMQMSGEDALMNVTVALASYSKPDSGLTVDLSVYDASGNCVLQPTQIGSEANFSEKPATTANAHLGEVGSRVTVSKPALWTAETPNLYTAVLQLKDGNKVLDTVSKRIGFKTVGVSMDDSGRQTFVLNGTPVTLRGILYNENSAVSGMAVSREEMISDIKLMKELNVNAVRSPGRPLSEEFISLCDEYGLYVIDDMSLNSNPYSNKDESSIPGDQSVWQNACLDRLLSVVYRDKNSASVIMWCVGNDSGVGSNFSVMRNWLTSADNRLIVYDDDNSASDLVIGADYSLNNFVQLLNDTTNKKAVLFQDTNGGLLNNGGNFSAYSDLMDQYSNFQGGFFSYWADNAIYWPISADDAAAVLQSTPYNKENADQYELTYAGSWNDAETSAKDTYQSLAGIVTADRKLQSDALELKNALSPVYIAMQDLATGTFKVTNRNSFTDFASAYEISYEITDGKNVVKSGTVSDLDVKPGQSATFTVDYGTDITKGNFYIYFTVKYKSAPSWTDSTDLTVLAKQISLTEDPSVSKDGSVQNHDGTALNLSIFQAPEVYVSNYTFSKGQMYVTNRSLKNFNELYTLSWTVYEKHAYWENPRWVIFDQGTLNNFNVPAGAENYLVNIGNKTYGAASEAKYAVHLVLTSKVDIAGVPAGTQFAYTLNTDESSNIPFRLDPARDPVEVSVDDLGEVTYGPAPMDEEPEVQDTDLVDLPEAPVSYDGASVLLLENDGITLRIDTNTGLITQYTVGGKEIFVNGETYTPSMISNLLRNPTGGDIVSPSVTTASGNILTALSQKYAETKTLPEGYKVTRVSDKQYRIELNYLWVTYPVQTMRTFSYDTYYTVVYDIYADGEIQVSVKYQPTVNSTVPLELSSIMTLTSDFTTMSWFGMGPGESYSDKPADSRVDTYKDVAIVDQLGSDYLYSTGSGDKTEVRWMALEREDGSGILITSDTDLLSVNVSKDYPWNSPAYVSSGASAARKNTVLRVIGQQRGVSVNTLFDQEYSDADYIEPGVNYTYSFRIVPVSAGYDADQISKTVLNSGTNLTAQETVNLNNNSFALTNGATPSTYLSVLSDGSVDVQAALGNASQYWIKENATDLNVVDAFRIKSLSKGLYLSPVSKDTYGAVPSDAELTLGTYRGLAWQNWIYEDNQLFCNGYGTGGYYALYLAGSTGFSNAGARLSLKAARSDEQSKWTVIADETDPTRIRIQSALSGKYLTVVDRMTYSNPLVEDYAFRARNYSCTVNWSSYNSIANATRYTAADTKTWIGADYYVTQWDLLPADSQMWTFVPAQGGYLIVNKQSGNALTVADGALTQAEVTNAAEQIWSVIPCDGMYGIVNTATNMALTLRSVNDTNVLTVYPWDSLAIQKWNFASEADLKVNVEAGNDWYN
ncbi:MAG: RICIN domain-containing protein [Clostridia bacterium]|nr:RICIN domain-containing protein [Clostridia bacterium]